MNYEELLVSILTEAPTYCSLKQCKPLTSLLNFCNNFFNAFILILLYVFLYLEKYAKPVIFIFIIMYIKWRQVWKNLYFHIWSSVPSCKAVTPRHFECSLAILDGKGLPQYLHAHHVPLQSASHRKL